MKYTLFLLLLAGSSTLLSEHANAQNRSADYRVAVDEFFEQIAQGKYAEALDYIYEGNPWIQNQKDNLQSMKTQFSGLTGLVGVYQGHEKLVEEDLAGKLVRVDYIVSFDRQPLRFEFQFYKPNGSWMTYAFKFQDDLGDWMDEKVRTKYFYSLDN